MYLLQDNSNFNFHTYRHQELLKSSQRISSDVNPLKTMVSKNYRFVLNQVGQQLMTWRCNMQRISGISIEV